jgi:hypothetical protein
MGDYLYNISSVATVATTHASSTTTTSSAAEVSVSLSMTGHVGVIVILSALVMAAILFFVCGLLLKAEAHLQVERDMFRGGLLVDSVQVTIDE